jgi:hypothetical protein
VLKIVHGIPFIGEATAAFRVRAFDLGNGHLEATATRVIAWHEADWSPEYMADVLEAIERAKAEEDAEERAALNRKRAARRAKTRVRRLCKAAGLDTLLTLTYRGAQPDLAVCKAHLKEFNRRMLKVLPSFCFVACFELQKRGTWHAHLATKAIPAVLPGGADFRSYNVIRAIWRSVTGDLEGNIDVQRRKRNSQKSAAQVAAYIAKYIGKGFEDADQVLPGANRWTRYGVPEVPEAVDLGIVENVYEAITVSYSLLMEAQIVSTARFDRWRDWFFVAGEIPQRRK